jgi:putative two-component system response regulator
MDVALESVLKSFQIASDKRDPSSTGHETRTALLCARLGRAIGLPEEDLFWLDVAARLHDVGKVMGIGGSIVNKPTQLTDAEMQQMKFHPAMGVQIVAPLGLDPRVNAAILHHHENWDGTGYPSELRGEDIPLFARIVRICDTYDSITVERSYRKPLTVPGAMMVLQTYAHNFDLRLLEAFLGLDLEGL